VKRSACFFPQAAVQGVSILNAAVWLYHILSFRRMLSNLRAIPPVRYAVQDWVVLNCTTATLSTTGVWFCRHSIHVTGCKVIPCSAAVDGQAFAFDIKIPTDRQVHQRCSRARARITLLAAGCEARVSGCCRRRDAPALRAHHRSRERRRRLLLPARHRILGSPDARLVHDAESTCSERGARGAGSNCSEGLDLPSLKAAGFTTAEVKAEGFDFVSAQSAR
jgi:hypothetical protein